MRCVLAALALVTGLASGLELGRAGVYDSPMAQDYYVRRYGFLFGGGRSGMLGLRALQADGLVQTKRQLGRPVAEMRNSVDTYYKAAMGHSAFAAPRRVKQLRTAALRKERTMVELKPKMMGASRPRMFHRFMAVP
jgi:hypothetical protein